MPRKDNEFVTTDSNPFVTTDSNPFVNLYLQTIAGKASPKLPIKSKSKKALVHSDTYMPIETPADLVWLSCCKGNPPLWPKVCPECYQYRTKDMGRIWMHDTVQFEDENAPKSKVILCQYCGHSSHHHMKGGGVCFDNILSPGEPTEDGHPTVIKTPCDCSCFLAPEERARQDIEDKVIRLMSKVGVQVLSVELPANPWLKSKGRAVTMTEQEAWNPWDEKTGRVVTSRITDKVTGDVMESTHRVLTGHATMKHYMIAVVDKDGGYKDFFISTRYCKPPSAASALITLYKNALKQPTKNILAFNAGRSGAGFEALCAQVQSDLRAVLGENYQTLEEFLG